MTSMRHQRNICAYHSVTLVNLQVAWVLTVKHPRSLALCIRYSPDSSVMVDDTCEIALYGNSLTFYAKNHKKACFLEFPL